MGGDPNKPVGTGDGGSSAWDLFRESLADPNFPIQSSFKIDADVALPGCGADQQNPIVVDRYHWYGNFGPMGGLVHLSLNPSIRDGRLYLGEDLASLRNLRFYETDGNPLPPFDATSLKLIDGELYLVGESGILPYKERLRVLEAFPYGFDAAGGLVCDADEQDQVAERLHNSSFIHDNGLPSSFTLSSLLYLSDELRRAQEAGGCPPDPDLYLNLPPVMTKDPLSLLAKLDVEGSTSVTGREISIPSINGRPEMSLVFGPTANQLSLDAHIDNPSVAQNFGGTCSADPTTLRAKVSTLFDVVAFKIGDALISAPLRGNWELELAARGLLKDPYSLWGHILTNGEVQLNGDIHVPAMEGLPEIRIAKGDGPTFLKSNLTVRGGLGSFTLNGWLETGFDFANFQAGDLVFPGPHSGLLNFRANSSGYTADLSAHVTLPQMSFPMPVSVALERGFLDVSAHVFVAPNPSPDNISGNFSADVNLHDVGARVNQEDIALSALLRAQGDFALRSDLISARTDLNLDLSARTRQADGRALLSAHLEAEDYGYCDADGIHVRRHLDVIGVSASMSGRYQKFSVSGPKNTLRDGIPTTFADEMIPPGIHVKADMQGMGIGLRTEATINLALNRAQIKTPQGTFIVSGQLVGKAQMINISQDPKKPNFRLVAGSLKAVLNNGSISQVDKGKTKEVFHGDMTLQDNLRGDIELVALAGIKLPFEIPNFKIGEIKAGLTVGKISIPKEGIRYFVDPASVGFTNMSVDPSDPALNMSLAEDPIPYYEPSAIDEVSVPSFLLKLAERNLGVVTTRGSAKVTGLQSGNPKLQMQSMTPFGTRRFKIPNGHVTLRGGYLSTTGSLERIGMAIRPPSVKTHFTMERNGLQFEFDGTLSSRSSIRVGVNLKKKTVALRESAKTPLLSGDLKVTVKNAKGEIVGAGKVGVSSQYELSGTASLDHVDLTVKVPETLLTAEVTEPINAGGVSIAKGTRLGLPIRGFGGEIHFDPQTLSAKSTWTLADVGTGDKVPELTLTGMSVEGMGEAGELKDVTADLSARAHRQQWEVVFKNKVLAFRALAGENGKPRKFELDLDVGDPEKAVTIIARSSMESQASGSINIESGEVELDITGLRFSLNVDGELKKLLPIKLNDLDTAANVPVLKARFNPKTNELGLRAVPTGMQLPQAPKSYGEFMSWTEDDWRHYVTALQKPEGGDPMVRQSERAASLPGALTEMGIPAGRGDILINLKKPLDETLTLDDTAKDRFQQIRDDYVDIRRVFPNPNKNEIPAPIIYSEAQSRVMQSEGPYGTLFFGHSRDLPRFLEAALGIPRSGNEKSVDAFVQNGRIEVKEMLSLLKEDKNIAAHVSDKTLESLVHSYFGSKLPRGTQKSDELRFLVALANLRTKLKDLLPVQNKGLRKVAGHQFVDTEFHTGSGADMSYMAVLPVSPGKAANVLKDPEKAAILDPWLSDFEEEGGVQKGTLLDDYDYAVTTSSETVGNIRMIHFHLIPKQDDDPDRRLKAYTRTIRLIPVENVVDDRTGQTMPQGTMILMDEHVDLPGDDSDFHEPRMVLPDFPQVTFEKVLNGMLQAVGTADINVPSALTNRFAQMAHALLKTCRGEEGTRARVGDILHESRTPISRTFPQIEFLTIKEEDEEKSIIRINDEEAKPEIIRLYLTEKLGVDATQAMDWITKKEIPIGLLQEKIDPEKKINPESFTGFIQAFLSNRNTMKVTGEKFTSKTERLLLVLKDMKDRLDKLADGSGGYPVDFRVLNDDRFHQKISPTSATQGDTVDTYTSYHIPGHLGFNLDQLMDTLHHTEDYDRLDENFAHAELVTVPGADPENVYVDTELKVPLVPNLLYRNTCPAKPFHFKGDVQVSSWSKTERPGKDDFLDNAGRWYGIKLSAGGWFLLREGILNTRPTVDRHPQVAKQGRDGLVIFMENVVSSAAMYAKTGNREAWTRSDARVVDYKLGRVIDENQ